uniref:hypothetical protein n=1 Tax=Cocconeiopsis kantsiensis TaxID=3082010 RepID=UPI0030012DC6
MLLFYTILNQKYKRWLLTEQALKNMKINYYKTFNKALKKSLNNSLFTKINALVTNSIIFLKPTDTKLNVTKKTIFNNVNNLIMHLLIVKLNNKIYKTSTVKKSYSLNYKPHKLLIFQLNTSLIKIKSK